MSADPDEVISEIDSSDDDEQPQPGGSVQAPQVLDNIQSDEEINERILAFIQQQAGSIQVEPLPNHVIGGSVQGQPEPAPAPPLVLDSAIQKGEPLKHHVIRMQLPGQVNNDGESRPMVLFFK